MILKKPEKLPIGGTYTTIVTYTTSETYATIVTYTTHETYTTSDTYTTIVTYTTSETYTTIVTYTTSDTYTTSETYTTIDTYTASDTARIILTIRQVEDKRQVGGYIQPYDAPEFLPCQLLHDVRTALTVARSKMSADTARPLPRPLDWAAVYGNIVLSLHCCKQAHMCTHQHFRLRTCWLKRKNSQWERSSQSW